MSTRYYIEEKISKGKEGNVYMGRNTVDLSKVIIKVLPYDEQSEQLITEIKEFQNFYSLVLVNYLDTYIENKELWIIMEYCPLESLKTTLKSGYRMNEFELREVIAYIVFGLTYLHDKNIVHGNIKLSNLFLSEDGAIKLGSYGLIQQLKRISKKWKGTRHTAPEVFTKGYTMKSDIWALGIAAIELAEGMNPYKTVSKDDLQSAICNNPSPSLSSSQWSYEFVDFVTRCLIKEESQRPTVYELREHPFLKNTITSIFSKGYSMCIQNIIRNYGVIKPSDGMSLQIKRQLMDYLRENRLFSAYHPSLHVDAIELYYEANFYYVDCLNTYSGMATCTNGLCIQWSLFDNKLIYLIITDYITKEFLFITKKDLSQVQHHAILDLSDEGERWEGDILNNEPMGWGKEYNKDNQLVYEGFSIKRVHMCYGTTYYGDLQTKEYCGLFLSGKAFGKGVRYDRAGNSLPIDYWQDGHAVETHIVIENIMYELTNRVEIIRIVDNCIEKDDNYINLLDFSCFDELKELYIGDNCFSYVTEFKICSLQFLQKVEIGSNCFVFSTYKGRPMQRSGQFICVNNIQLQHITIGRLTCCEYSECIFEGLPSLQTITIGEKGKSSWNFCYASFILTYLPQLTTIDLGDYCFEQARRLTIKNLPSLRSITMGIQCFYDYTGAYFEQLPLLEVLEFNKHCLEHFIFIVIENLPNLHHLQLDDAALIGVDTDSSSAIIRNLPYLQSFVCKDNSFQFVRSLIVENIPYVTTVELSTSFNQLTSSIVNNVAYSLGRCIPIVDMPVQSRTCCTII